jgi:hypothetical protein
MQNPKPFTVFQTIPGQTFPKPLFVIHAYSLEQARALVSQGRGRDHRCRSGLARRSQPMIPIPGAAFPRWPASQRCRRRLGAAWSAKPWSSPSS